MSLANAMNTWQKGNNGCSLNGFKMDPLYFFRLVARRKFDFP